MVATGTFVSATFLAHKYVVFVFFFYLGRSLVLSLFSHNLNLPGISNPLDIFQETTLKLNIQ